MEGSTLYFLNVGIDDGAAQILAFSMKGWEMGGSSHVLNGDVGDLLHFLNDGVDDGAPLFTFSLEGWAMGNRSLVSQWRSGRYGAPLFPFSMAK